MLKIVPVLPGGAPVSVFLVRRLQREGVVMNSKYVYRLEHYCVIQGFVKHEETVVVRTPRNWWDTSAAVVVARVIDV